jgi:hypothetical protein
MANNFLWFCKKIAEFYLIIAEVMIFPAEFWKIFLMQSIFFELLNCWKLQVITVVMKVGFDQLTS